MKKTKQDNQVDRIRGALGFLVLLGIILLSGLVFVTASGNQPSENPLLGALNVPQFNGSPNSLYLPIAKAVAESRPYNVFGAESYLTAQDGFPLLDSTQAHWVHGIFVPWADVEPSAGSRLWGVLATEEQKMRTAAENQFSSIVLVRKTPGWAQRFPGIECGAILPSRYDEFADFMYDLVQRYSGYPYYVKYWEIWNEPDPAPDEVDPTAPIGCWGDRIDTFGYGGGVFADMLKQIYPAIKAADPEAQVLIGGLLLGCKPDLGDPDVCPSSWFLRGILDNGGGPYFDGVAFHSYDYYFNWLGGFGNGGWVTGWDNVGPVIGTKADFIRGLLSDYGQSSKFIMNLEVALLCDTDWDYTCDSEFETTKAYYLAQAYAMTIGEDIFGTAWYGLSIDFPGRQSALLDENLNPFPAYYTFEFSSSILSGATQDRDLTEYPNVSGYVFDRDGKEVWVLWSRDGSSHWIILPGSPSAAYEIGTDGMPDSLIPSTSLNVTLAPIFLEW
jgi:hypothetical protein